MSLPSPPGPPGGLFGPSGVPLDLSRTYGWAFRNSGWASRPLPDLGWALQTSGWAFWNSRCASQPLLDLRVGLPDLRLGLSTPPRPAERHPKSIGPQRGTLDTSRTSGWASRPILTSKWDF